MFYEKLNFQFDIDNLRQSIKDYVFTLGDRVIQGEEYETHQYNGFGGWSLLSRTGDWKDGFAFFQNEEGTALEKVFFPKNANNYETLKYFDIAHSMEYKNPTQACKGYIKEVLDEIAAAGLTPRRARVTCLKAGSKSLVHSDGPPSEYISRIHIPLWTNEKCVHICEGYSLHMPADGSAYMLWVNNWHQIRNDSDEDRYHIIMDAYDTKFITNNFHYLGNIDELEQFVLEQRKKIDSTVITDDLRELFEQTLLPYRLNK